MCVVLADSTCSWELRTGVLAVTVLSYPVSWDGTACRASIPLVRETPVSTVPTRVGGVFDGGGRKIAAFLKKQTIFVQGDRPMLVVIYRREK
jgi:hypothetical protein